MVEEHFGLSPRLAMAVRPMARIAILAFLAMATSPALADWFAQADFSACPRQYIPQTSASEGPFSTPGACSARLAEVQRQSPMACARYACNSTGGSGASATSSDSTTNALAGALTSGMRGLTTQQIMGVGITALAISALMQTPDPQQQAADQAAEAATQAALRQQREQQRQEQERRAEATKQELLHSLKGTGASTDLALKDAGAGGELQLKTGDSSPPPKAVIHEGFSLPMSEPYQQ
jgi:hypothetical protein